MYYYSHFRDEDTNLREVKYLAQYHIRRWKSLDLNAGRLRLQVSNLNPYGQAQRLSPLMHFKEQWKGGKELAGWSNHSRAKTLLNLHVPGTVLSPEHISVH